MIIVNIEDLQVKRYTHLWDSFSQSMLNIQQDPPTQKLVRVFFVLILAHRRWNVFSWIKLWFERKCHKKHSIELFNFKMRLFLHHEVLKKLSILNTATKESRMTCIEFYQKEKLQIHHQPAQNRSVESLKLKDWLIIDNEENSKLKPQHKQFYLLFDTT